MPRNLGPAPSWELEKDSLADRLRSDTGAILDPGWRARVAKLAPTGVTLEDIIARAIELTKEDA